MWPIMTYSARRYRWWRSLSAADSVDAVVEDLHVSSASSSSTGERSACARPRSCSTCAAPRRCGRQADAAASRRRPIPWHGRRSLHGTPSRGGGLRIGSWGELDCSSELASGGGGGRGTTEGSRICELNSPPRTLLIWGVRGVSRAPELFYEPAHVSGSVLRAIRPEPVNPLKKFSSSRIYGLC
jgi:hypothetical protein